MRNRLLVLSVGTSLVAAAIAGTAGAATASAGQVGRLAAQPPRSVSSAPATYFDSRASAAPLQATAAQTAAVRSMVREIGSGARITYDPIFGTPRELLRYGGYLTGPRRGQRGRCRAGLAERTPDGVRAVGRRRPRPARLVLTAAQTRPGPPRWHVFRGVGHHHERGTGQRRLRTRRSGAAHESDPSLSADGDRGSRPGPRAVRADHGLRRAHRRPVRARRLAGP